MALWTPAEITTALWLDASDASTLFDATTGGSLVSADGAVARWEDKSGNDRHATQPTASAMPQRKVSDQNGLDTLLFDGVSDHLTGTAITLPAGVCMTAIVIPTSALGLYGYNGAFLQNAESGNQDHFGSTTFGDDNTWYDSFYSSTRPKVSQSVTLSNWHSVSITQNATQKIARVNDNTITLSANYATSTTLQVGRSVSTYYFGGKIAELAILPTNESLEIAEGYMAHRWGVAANLAVDHPYKSAAPTTGTISQRRRRDQQHYQGGL